MIRSGITHGFPTFSILLSKRVHSCVRPSGKETTRKEKARSKVLGLFLKAQCAQFPPV